MTEAGGGERDYRAQANAAAVLAVLSWGVGNIIIKTIDAGSLALGFHRFWIAALVTVAVLRLRRRSLTRSALRVALPSGIAFALNTLAMFTALKLTTVANATVIAALQPVVVIALARRRYHERLAPIDVAVVAVAIVGVALVVFGSAGLPEWRLVGDFVALLSLGTWTWYFMSSKQARLRLDTIEHQTAVAIVGALVLAPVLLLSGQAVGLRGPGSWLGVVLLVVIPGGGHFLLSWAHRHTSLTLTSLLTLGTPVVSTALAAVALDERVALLQGVGMAVVLGALAALIVRSPRFVAPRAGAAETVEPVPPVPLALTPPALQSRTAWSRLNGGRWRR